ncbi:c-type cytochrome [Chenggangzhangella methanolivorans]|uniref:c-type cytochrome n=1 Tax=Chenggangzhangella methanolivorans TaxID=1437009 RepID=UPI0028F4530E|nr:c-type cytochrome [Chenggangzhangella methanolivorans]
MKTIRDGTRRRRRRCGRRTAGAEMDTFKLNKIAGAVLGTLTVLLGVNVLVEEVFHQKKPEKPGYEVAEKKEGGEAAGGGAAAPAGALALLASADPAKGEQSSKKCAACHSFGKGEPAKAGPNLYGVIGLKHAHMEGFGYSDAMKKTADKTWDFENMDHWLENPKGYIQGTTMAFMGVKDPQRANLLAYLNKNSDKPLDLPKVEAKPAAAGGAPAAGGGRPRSRRPIRPRASRRRRSARPATPSTRAARPRPARTSTASSA